MAVSNQIVVSGAREHNLRDVTVSLPRDRLVVITGLSGSGKSSLAFDTLYAEGQRRYVESLSAYARQFLGQMDKPDVDSIEGLSPAISIDQKTTARNPRSTVGTVTEIYDYLRLLYARVGTRTAPSAAVRSPARRPSRSSSRCWRCPRATRFTVDAPVVRTRKGEYRDAVRAACAATATRASRSTGRLLLEEPIELDKQVRHSISVVVDRLVMKPGLRTRLTDSVETAAAAGRGAGRGGDRRRRDDDVLREVRVPRRRHLAAGARAAHLLVQLAARRLPALHRPRHPARDRPRPGGARPEPLDPQGALVPWTVINSNFYTQVIQAIADRYEVDLDTPWADLPEEHRNLFLQGTGGDSSTSATATATRKRSYMLAFEGIVPSLERRYRETDSAYQKERIEEYMALKPCPACHGDRLKETSSR